MRCQISNKTITYASTELIVLPSAEIELIHQKIFALIEQPTLLKEYMVKSKKRADEFTRESLILKYVETIKNHF